MHSMIRRVLAAAPILALALALGWWLARRSLEPERRRVDVVATAGGGAPDSPAPDAVETDRDREIFREKMAWAHAERLDTLPLGEIVARLGRTFVGTTYTPQTLEVDGPERLVVNLRELDCVTFVENTLAMARLIRAGEFEDYDAYRRELVRIRYRGGVIDGYPSRLHYFSDWIADGEAKGLVRNVSREIGGVPDDEPVDFMSTHPDAYRQLADPAALDAIRRVEAGVTARSRYVVPEGRVAEVGSATATSSPRPARSRGSTSRTRASRSGSTAGSTCCTRRSSARPSRSARYRWPSGSWTSRGRTGSWSPVPPDVDRGAALALRTDQPHPTPHVGQVARRRDLRPGQQRAAGGAGDRSAARHGALQLAAFGRGVTPAHGADGNDGPRRAATSHAQRSGPPARQMYR